MSKLVGNITKLSKQKMIPAVIIDILGARCSIRLSTRGTVIRNLPYFGPTPVVGDSVFVNYASGSPVVMTTGTSPEADTVSLQAAPKGNPVENGSAKYHNDLPGIQGGVEATEADPAEYYHLTEAEHTALGEGAGHEIWDSDEAFDPEPILQFTGAGVTVTDDPGVQTIVNIEGGGGLDATLLIMQEDHSAECNGVTTDFIADEAYVLEKTHIFLNGLLQQVDVDYTENVDCRTISMIEAPIADDVFTFSYIMNETPPSGIPVGPYTRLASTLLFIAGTHAHTDNSDGAMTEAAYAAALVADGYDILIMSDHDKITADPGGGHGLTYIPADEQSPATGHVVGLNSTYLRVAETDQQTIIDGIVAGGGVAILVHPKWTTGHTYANMAARTGYLGLEIFNQTVETGTGGSNGVSNPGFDIADWDALLTNVRNDIFGFVGDDYHDTGDYKRYGIARTIIFAEGSSLSELMTALGYGDFVSEVSNPGVTPALPVITANDVSIECPGATRIRFIGPSGAVLDTVEGDTASYDFTIDDDYVRIEAVGEYIEGFGAALSDFWDTVDGTWTVSGGILAQTGTGGAKKKILKKFRAGDFTAQVDVRLSSTATDHSSSLMFNVIDSNRFYIMRIGGGVGGLFDGKLSIGKTTSNSFAAETPIGTYVFAPSANVWYTIKMEYTASNGRIRAKIWVVGAEEPDWQIDENDTTWTHGCFGFRAGDESDYDNLDIDGFITYYQPLPVGDWV